MTPTDQTILTAMQGVIDNFLIPKFIALGMNASGQWIESLEARVVDGRGEIWGRDYTYYLVNGRAGGSMPPITPLVSWVGHKFGLSGKQAQQAAWAVAKKIQREGTDYYPNGTDLLEVLQSKEVTQYVYDMVKADISGQVRATIVRNLRQTFA